MNIYISGSNGLIGSALKQSLLDDGHTVKGLGRDFSQPINFEGIDGVIHLAGENIAEGRWSKTKKDLIKSSRVDNTQKLSNQIYNSEHKPNVFISASAIGFYGDTGSDLITENSPAGKGFLPEVSIDWEAATKPVENAGVRVIHLRTGIVLSKKGGALKKMLPPFLLGGGGILGSGKQYMSWISIDDMIGAIKFLVNDSSLKGPFNLTAPKPVNNKDFTKILGKVIKRPTILPLPGFIAKLIFGEMAEALLLSGSNVIPEKLLDSGYIFKHSELREALKDLLTKK